MCCTSSNLRPQNVTNDERTNSLGIAYNHAYSLLKAKGFSFFAVFFEIFKKISKPYNSPNRKIKYEKRAIRELVENSESME